MKLIAVEISDKTNPEKGTTVKKLTLSSVSSDGLHLMPDLLGEAGIHHGGVKVFAPGETAHPEPRHVHEKDEVFILLQGEGVLPIDGEEYPVKAGDVCIVAAGEDHHLASSVEQPLVAAWYMLDRAAITR